MHAILRPLDRHPFAVSGSTPDETPKRILIVEDERVVALDLRASLEEMGYEVVGVAASSADALRKAAQGRPDLVLMDVRLDGPIDGIETAAVLRTLFQLPIVYLTANADSVVLNRALATTPGGYLTKPYSEQTLRTTIEVAFRRHASEQELRQAHQDELQASKVRLRAILESSGDMGTWDLQVVSLRFSWDAALAALLGKSGKKHRSARMKSMLRFIHRDDRAHVEREFRTAINGTGDLDIEFRLQTKDNEVRWLVVKGHADGILRGQPVHIRGACGEVTMRKAAEAAQFQGQKLEGLGTLAAGIAHDFSNILLAINNNATLALSDATDQGTRTRLENIQLVGTRAASLVRQILNYSRSDEPTHDLIALTPIVEESGNLLRSAIPSSIDLRIVAPTRLPAVAIDPTQLQQIVINLVTNAAHAIGADRKGTIELKVDSLQIDNPLKVLGRDLQPGQYVRLSVSDTGSGIDHTTLTKIFDPFFTTKPVGQGTGLGLAMVNGIVRTCGASISVSSTVGVGTTFVLHFPAVTIVGNAVDVLEIKAAPIPRGNGEHILYVDDDAILVELGVETLQNLGYLVTGYSSGHAALEHFRSRPVAFDMVITDLSMPSMSGLELGRHLLAVRPNIPIIVMSAAVKAADQAVAIEIGVREIVLKPQNLDELGFSVHRILNKL